MRIDGVRPAGKRTGPGRALVPLLALLLAPLLLALPAAGALNPGAPAPEPDFSPYPWIFRRDGRTPAPDEPVVSLLIVGDVMPGRGVALGAHPASPLADAGWLAAADLTLGNLEAVLADEGLAPRAER